MEKTFKVTINAKRGALISGSEIETAVFGTSVAPGDFNYVLVEEVVDNAVTEFDYKLFALAQKRGRAWRMVDFFNSEKKADNAVRKAADNFKKCGLDGTFAKLAYYPASGAWRVEGKAVKV